MNLSKIITATCCCGGSPACPDTSCTGAALARECEAECASCRGSCPAPQACLQPERAPRRRMFVPTFDLDGPHFPRTREGWGRFIGAVLGMAGFAFIAGAVGRHLGYF